MDDPFDPRPKDANGVPLWTYAAERWLGQKRRADRAESALRTLVRHIETIPYRDGAGLRLGSGVPHFENAKAVLGEENR